MRKSQSGGIAVRIGYFFAGAVWGLLIFFYVLDALDGVFVLLGLAACLLVCGALGAVFGPRFFEWLHEQMIED